MSTKNRILHVYTDGFEAEIVRDRLAAAGIQAFVVGTDMATALSLGGAGTIQGVRLEVSPADYDLAIETLVDDDRRLREAGYWKCGRCSEPNQPAFELCWSCNKPRSDDDERIQADLSDFEPPSAQASDFDAIEVPTQAPLPTEDGNPYRPVLMDDRDGHTHEARYAPGFNEDELDDKVRRALVAACASTMLLPPLSSAYVISLLWRLPPAAYGHPSRRRRINAAWWITMLGLIIGVAYLSLFFG
ncbi:hypothetical protein Poly51_52200 [Rubripirellula tenax]|uniref:RanBP2-type domain-containing protein n=1 Tax=Rubripirellula tenax TaxID=2528015 RepID=A0A5C6EFQ6_9BACT|nr:DUF2007 domain-containing protein [Rubripirellula tenax]TWU47420.1 hypothetical protein Poly51_52200 [Rubripirellula tenax]